MYILIGVLFIICILFFIINFFRRKYVIRKICSMEYCQKLHLFNELAAPFGFSYLPEQDIVTSRIDAWQKNFGYCFIYDKSASRFNMVFDCEPIYFDYDGRTWMIEFWKGQYGINIGSEVGIYRADTILVPEQYENVLFHAVPNDELLPISMKLNYKEKTLFSVCRSHWWLTGFRMGSYCEPEDLSLDISITFPSEEMLQCFVNSLICVGYHECELCICNMTVSFSFSILHTKQPRLINRCRAKYSQWKNRIFCKLYRLITKPFVCTIDRILYLYFFLPFTFRKLLRFKKNSRQKFHVKRGKRR